MHDDGQTDRSPAAGFLARLPLATSLSLGEERANAATHAVAAAGSVVALTELLRVAVRSGSLQVLVGAAVFGFTLLNLYLVSTLYHSINRSRTKRLLRLLDHLSILYLVAGSYTVVALLFLAPPMRTVIIASEWGLAGIGTLYKIFYLGRRRALSVVLYLLMGWFAVVAWRQILGLWIGELNLWLLVGGLFYTVGLTFFGMKRLRYHHAIWHLFVIAGSFCHVFGLYQAIALAYG